MNLGRTNTLTWGSLGWYRCQLHHCISPDRGSLGVITYNLIIFQRIFAHFIDCLLHFARSLGGRLKRNVDIDFTCFSTKFDTKCVVGRATVRDREAEAGRCTGRIFG